MQDSKISSPQATVHPTNQSEPVVAKKKSSKKIVVILLLVFLVFPLLCCGLFFILFSVIFGAVNDKKVEVINAVLMDVCNSHGDFTFDEYGQWFDSSVGYQNAVDSTEVIFPEGYDCNDLDNSSFLDAVLAGESVSYKNENGQESLEISVNDGFFSLEKSRGVWVITEIDYN